MKIPILKTLTGTFFALVLLVPSAGLASDDEWKFEISPYAWLPAMDITSTVNGLPTDIDMSFGDIWKNFDVFALSLRGEAWKGEWGMVLDGMWIDLDGDFGPNESVNVKIQDGVVDLLGGYRIKEGDWVIDALPGLRYVYLKQEISIDPLPTLGASYDWVELVIGGRIAWNFAERWLLALRGDLAGFGIGSASDLEGSVNAGAGWQATDWLMLKLGYRYYYIDYSRGSGRDKFGIDGSMQGAYLALTFIP